MSGAVLPGAVRLSPFDQYYSRDMLCIAQSHEKCDTYVDDMDFSMEDAPIKRRIRGGGLKPPNRLKPNPQVHLSSPVHFKYTHHRPLYKILDPVLLYLLRWVLFQTETDVYK